jgi:peptidoglycan/xylan/chitin deacetylase (PgdA/CDA1 family)
VFCYHSVHPSKPLGNTQPHLFDLHMQWLKEHCDLISLGDALSFARGPARPRPAVAVTFDDGYADVHEYALPVLQKYSIHPTLFMLTGLADGNPRVIRRMAMLERIAPEEVKGLTWSQIVEMRQARWEIGSHTITHVDLGAADPVEVLQELKDSKAILEDRLGEPVTQFAYPFGKPKHHVNPATMRMAAESGYTTGGTITYRAVRPGDSALAIPRFAVADDTLETLAAKVMGKLDVIGLWQERAPRWLSRLISPQTTVFDHVTGPRAP